MAEQLRPVHLISESGMLAHTPTLIFPRECIFCLLLFVARPSKSPLIIVKMAREARHASELIATMATGCSMALLPAIASHAGAARVCRTNVAALDVLVTRLHPLFVFY